MQSYSRFERPKCTRTGCAKAFRALRRLGFLFVCGLAALGILPWGYADGGQDLQAAVAGLQHRYAAIDTIRADFQQTYEAPGILQRESGTVWMKKPGLMRWEYRDPETKFFIADGRETYLYTPDEGQVLVRRFSEDDLRSTPLRFLLGQGDIEDSFEVSTAPAAAAASEGAILLRLSPREPGLDYAFVDLELDARSYDLRGMDIHESTGNTSRFRFTRLETNVRLDDNLFRFKPPKGVEVIRVDDK